MITDFVRSLAAPFSRILNASLENPSFSLNDPVAWDELTSGSKSTSGESVTETKTLEVAPFWQGVSMISGDVASMSLHVYRKTSNNDRETAVEHKADIALSSVANEEVTAFDFWRRLVIHTILWGNGYAFIDRSGNQIRLYNLLPDRTEKLRDRNGQAYYRTFAGDSREEKIIAFSDILHVIGPSLDSSGGINLVKKSRECIGNALAARGFSGAFFGRGMQAGGILEVPRDLSVPAKEKLVDGFAKKYVGKDNWFKVVILRDGAKFHQTMVDAEKSQLLETREHEAREAARYLNLPPSKLGIAGSVSYNSFEQSQVQYVTSTLLHWRKAITSQCDAKLLTPEERRTHYCEHNVSILIETDSKSMNEVLEIQRRNEIISANEWRRKINLPPRSDAGGDEYINPNTRSRDQQKQDDAPKPKSVDNSQEKAALLRDVIDRAARRACLEARKRSKDPAKFQAFVEYDLREGSQVFTDQLTLVVNVIVDQKSRTEIINGSVNEFYRSLNLSLEPLLDQPASGLERKAALACEEFERTIANKLIDGIFSSMGWSIFHD